MVTLSSCLIWQIISCILAPKEYDCVCAWKTLRYVGLRSTYKKCRLWQKKIIFSDEAHFDLGRYVNKQNCRIWGIENPQANFGKPTHPNHPKRLTVWCRFWSELGYFFYKKWAKRDRYSQWRSLSSHSERIFVHKNWRRGHWHHLVLTHSGSYNVLLPVFEDRIITRRADVVWPPRSCDLTPSDYYLWGAVKDKSDKPETIDALTDNIRETIDEIQLHTIDNVLKNWTDRVHAQPRRPFEWNYFYYYYTTGRIVLSNKKRNLIKYLNFPKKKVFGGSSISRV